MCQCLCEIRKILVQLTFRLMVMMIEQKLFLNITDANGTDVHVKRAAARGEGFQAGAKL